MKKQEDNFYAQKRKETQLRILNTTKLLLLQQGFSAVTMDGISKAVGISRQRLYKYFSNIDEVIYEIQIRSFGTFIDHLTNNLIARTGTASDDLKALVATVFEYEKEHTEDFIFTYEFDAFYRQRIVPATLKKRYLDLFNNTEFLHEFGLLIQTGIQQHEFRSDLNIAETADFWCNIIQLLCQRIALCKVNGESHSEGQLKSLVDNFNIALFRYLQ